jgi:Phage integrase family
VSPPGVCATATTKGARQIAPSTRDCFPPKQAGISKHVTAHTLRHTAATWLRQATGDTRLVAEYLGHSDLSTVSRYAHVASEELHAAAQALADGPDQLAPPPPPAGVLRSDSVQIHPDSSLHGSEGCARPRALLKIAARHGS